MRIFTAVSLVLLLAACTGHEPGAYHLTQTVPVSGDGGWDFVKVQDETRRVYIAHSTQIEVLDADSGKPVGVIRNIQGAHGIAIAADSGKGFITNGKSNSVTVFDVKTLAILGQIATEKKPDAILYDSSTKRVFAFNAGSGSATIIDARKARKIGTVTLGGAPEFAVSDKKGSVFVNLEDKSEMLKINARSLQVVKRWPLAPCAEPSSLAMDRESHRLFAGCSNHILTVVNAENGAVVTTLPIGEKVDATAFDPDTKLVISSNGDGTMTVIHEDSPDHYRVVQTITTPKRSKTSGLDKKTHKLFVPAAEFGAAPAPTAENPKPRPAVIPGSFKVLVFEKS